MEPARSCEDLIVWQKAHAFTLAVYRMTAGFPKAKCYIKMHATFLRGRSQSASSAKSAEKP